MAVVVAGECGQYNNNTNRRLATLAEHTSDHGKQTNSNTNECVWGELEKLLLKT